MENHNDCKCNLEGKCANCRGEVLSKCKCSPCVQNIGCPAYNIGKCIHSPIQVLNCIPNEEIDIEDLKNELSKQPFIIGEEKKSEIKFIPFYDSEVDTLRHIKRVSNLMIDASIELMNRAKVHDDSKLTQEEKPYFDKLTPLLKGSDYGSTEYNEFMHQLQVPLKNHYAKNSHHPQHYENGIDGMNLFDVMEMFFDWKAASERHENGDINKSIEINQKRFDMSDQLVKIFQNTVKHLEWQK